MNKARLVLGTAEFNPNGYADVLPIERRVVKNIFDCARAGGINLLDTAESYNCHALIRQYAKGFCIYDKTRDWKVHLDWGDNELRGLLYHYGFMEDKIELPFIHRWVNLGASVYCQAQIPEEQQRIIQIPFNINNAGFAHLFSSYRTIFVRSVFGRGELLKDYSVKECLDFVKGYLPDGVIVGVKTVKELEGILTAW